MTEGVQGIPFVELIAAAAVLLLSPFFIPYILSWLAALLITPLALLMRVVERRPWPVVAYVSKWADFRQEYRGFVVGSREADALAARVRDEIKAEAKPTSLIAPTHPG
ncbi:hypothetical protein SMC26_20295 [Actinomadura fulvescens]|uniref:hypothetical protein n=1 Tax=Actinomadura fulvescens TaxID=46160 RepID=UPI0031E39664